MKRRLIRLVTALVSTSLLSSAACYADSNEGTETSAHARTVLSAKIQLAELYLARIDARRRLMAAVGVDPAGSVGPVVVTISVAAAELALGVSILKHSPRALSLTFGTDVAARSALRTASRRRMADIRSELRQIYGSRFTTARLARVQSLNDEVVRLKSALRDTYDLRGLGAGAAWRSAGHRAGGIFVAGLVFALVADAAGSIVELQLHAATVAEIETRLRNFIRDARATLGEPA